MCVPGVAAARMPRTPRPGLLGRPESAHHPRRGRSTGGPAALRERLGVFDAVLAATAGRAGTTAIVSADAAFAEADVPHVVPDAPGVAGLMQSRGRERELSRAR